MNARKYLAECPSGFIPMLQSRSNEITFAGLEICPVSASRSSVQAADNNPFTMPVITCEMKVLLWILGHFAEYSGNNSTLKLDWITAILSKKLIVFKKNTCKKKKYMKKINLIYPK